eukprot:Mycagemm_TRINITY_DN9397_c0_g2::TRINITY_DN9397_c0_g2_i1::g.3165::m.3165 type:complete len:114 gc:universal TRINITY_DN9397_c0_g2_i1:548-207(-)
MIWEHRTMRLRLFLRAMSITVIQYSLARALISSDDHINLTFVMSMPQAFQISIIWRPISWIFLISPPILSFIRANQSATQKINWQPALVSLLTLFAFIMPCAMCMRPEGSNPS